MDDLLFLYCDVLVAILAVVCCSVFVLPPIEETTDATAKPAVPSGTLEAYTCIPVYMPDYSARGVRQRGKAAETGRQSMLLRATLACCALAADGTSSASVSTTKSSSWKSDNRQPCAVVDISTGVSTLHEAQQQAREAAALCVIVRLGQRSYQLTEPLVLTFADSNTRWVGQGAEVTTGYDVPPEAWTQVSENGVAAVQINASLLVNRSQWGQLTLSNGLEDGHLSLLVKVGGVWRPMTVARWPNIPFEYADSPPTNWTTVAATTCAPSNTSCLEFTWAADTDRPARWVDAAKEGRLFLHGFFVALWKDSRGQIQHVDVANRQLRSTVTNPQQTGGVNNESIIYAYGMYEELDTPGEYILRDDTGMLSAIMPAECIGPAGNVVCPTRLLPDIKKLHFQECLIVGHAYLTSLNCSMTGVIQVIDAANITLVGLNLTGSFGTGITIFGGTGITIDSCEINNHNTVR